MKISRAAMLLAVSACIANTACSNQPQTAGTVSAPTAVFNLVGAGSTLDYPFFSRAFYQYNQGNPNVKINYQSIGSGGGIRQFTAGTVDFGATDVPMSAAESAAVPKDRPFIQVPITLGAAAIAYNLPNGPPHLKLSSSVLADIFLGKITKWNDARITALNSGATIPNLPIAVVHRADGSGTTYIFTDYLSRVSADWKTTVGKGKTVKWPAPSSIGVKGNEGVAGQIQSTPGAIGYVELAYALQTQIAYAALQNKSGAFVLPSLASVAAAAAAKPNVSPQDFSIVDEGGAKAYPVAGFSWVLLYREYPDKAKTIALRDLFSWMLADGQKQAAGVNYPELPKNVAAAAAKLVATMGKR